MPLRFVVARDSYEESLQPGSDFVIPMRCRRLLLHFYQIDQHHQLGLVQAQIIPSGSKEPLTPSDGVCIRHITRACSDTFQAQARGRVPEILPTVPYPDACANLVKRLKRDSPLRFAGIFARPLYDASGVDACAHKHIPSLLPRLFLLMYFPSRDVRAWKAGILWLRSREPGRSALPDNQEMNGMLNLLLGLSSKQVSLSLEQTQSSARARESAGTPGPLDTPFMHACVRQCLLPLQVTLASVRLFPSLHESDKTS